MAIEITSQSLAGTPSEEPAVYKESPARALSGFPATDKSVSRSRFWHPTSRWTRRNFSSRASALSGGEDIILLARDPRDCFVSLYLQLTRRDPHAPVELRRKSVSEMLRDRRFGVHAIVNTMNNWIKEFSGRDDFIVIRYESLRASPAEYFRDLLAVLGESAPDMTMFHDALEFSRFENMQKLEAAGAFDSKILHPGDVRDPESFKVRRGKVGGYREYLSAEDQQYAANALAERDPRFGYSF